MHFADLDGDGDTDYLVVGTGGVVTAWRNDDVDAVGGGGWRQLGRIAAGVPMSTSDRVAFTDFDGDGDGDDYLVVAFDHVVTAWRNDGTSAAGGGGWTPKGQIARPSGSIHEVTMFANLTCDRRAEYVLRDPSRSNMLTGWTNVDGFANQWAAKKKVDWGVPIDYLPEIHLADLSGNGLDDYLIVDPRTGAVQAWLNAGGNQDAP